MPTMKSMMTTGAGLVTLFGGVAAQAAYPVAGNDTVAIARDAGTTPQVLARKGADDKAGHIRHGRGRDDAPNHASSGEALPYQVARKGADDKPGHVRRGRGADDKAGHIRGGKGADDAAGDDRGGRA